jgi:hypothetical protein
MEPLADAIKEASMNLSVAIGFASLCYLAVQVWKWR